MREIRINRRKSHSILGSSPDIKGGITQKKRLGNMKLKRDGYRIFNWNIGRIDFLPIMQNGTKNT